MTHTAEIICVGTELLLGNVVNTNASEISEALSELGINVYYHTVAGDNPERLRAAIDIAAARADIIITTGGLGPTCDDLTKQTLADAFDLKMVMHEDQAEHLKKYYFGNLHNAAMTSNNLRQTVFPEGCTIFPNECGTAPGCAFFARGVHVLMLPGPPREMRDMLKKQAVPYLLSLSDYGIHSHVIHVFGMGESLMEDKLHDLMETMTNPTLAPYAKEGEALTRITARTHSPEEAEALMAPVMEEVLKRLGDVVYGVDMPDLETVCVKLLSEKELTLACAESCTGGMLSKRITDVPGASKVFLGGITAYSAAVKEKLLDIPPELISSEGVVSRDVALAMAAGARKALGADLGIGITGLAGPDGDGSEVPVGTVYVALSSADASYCRKLKLGNNRVRTRTVASSHALDMIRRSLTGLPVENK